MSYEGMHTASDLKQMQAMPLDIKIRMTQDRIRGWCDGWTRFEICDDATGEVRYVTLDTRNRLAEPEMKESEFILSAYRDWAYVSWSGGNDSTVLKHIVDSMGYDIPAVFVNTGLEYPEIQQFVRDTKAGKYECFNSNVEILRPEISFTEVIKNYGYPVISKNVSHYTGIVQQNPNSPVMKLFTGEKPTIFLQKNKWNFLIDAPFKISDKCCYYMKKTPCYKYVNSTGRKPLLGTMAAESASRRQAWLKNGCNAFCAKMPQSTPMAFWTEQDILRYLKEFDVPYCSVYGDIRLKPYDGDQLEGQMNWIDYTGNYEPEYLLETTGCDRTGCIFCAYGSHLESDPNRFQRLKQTHPRQYDYCINGGQWVDGKWQPSQDGLGLGYVLDYIGVKY